MLKKTKNRIFAILLAIVMVFGVMPMSIAVQASDVPEFIVIDNVTFVPLRTTMESMGALVDWDGENQTVIILLGDELILIGVEESGSFIEDSRTWTPANYLNAVLLPIFAEQWAVYEPMLAELAKTSEDLTDMSDEEAKETMTALGMYAYYFKDIRQHSLNITLPQIDVPFLVMQGERDFQVLADVDFALIKELLSGRDNVEFKLCPNLNHFFVETTATNFSEHGAEMSTILGKIDRQVLQDMAEWILGEPITDSTESEEME